MSAMGFAVRIAVALAFAAFLSWKFNFINGIGLAIALLLFLFNRWAAGSVAVIALLAIKFLLSVIGFAGALPDVKGMSENPTVWYIVVEADMNPQLFGFTPEDENLIANAVHNCALANPASLEKLSKEYVNNKLPGGLTIPPSEYENAPALCDEYVKQLRKRSSDFDAELTRRLEP